MATQKIISFILPVFNEEDNIENTYYHLLIVIKKLLKTYDYEIIFVNDGSSDNSWAIIEIIAQNNPKVRGICFSKNFGYQSALTAGYDNAYGDALITMDADMQHPPFLVESMIQKWENGSKIVYARRINRDDGFLKKFTAYCYYKLLYAISEVKIPRNVNDFRLIDKQVAFEIKRIKEKARYLRGIVAWVGHNHDYIDFEQPARTSGVSKYTWLKLFKIACDGIISFSHSPFKYLNIFVILIFITGSGLLHYKLFSFLFLHIHITRFTLLTLVIYLLVGIQLMIVQRIGEGIGTIYDSAKKRPHYIIDEKINC